MEKLFGVPVDQLTVTLLIIFGVGVAIMSLVALRNRVMFKMAVRNIPRHRAQSLLIVVGLMLATMLFSAAFTMGDTLTNSIRAVVVGNLGEVDVVVQPESPEVSGRAAYFDQSYFETIRQALADDPEVEGVAPLVVESAPVVAPASRQSEPGVTVLGIAEEWMQGFDSLEDAQGGTLSVAALQSGQAYVSNELADELDIAQGDTVQVYLGPRPTSFEVAGVYQKGGNPAEKLSLVMPMERLQTLVGKDGQIAAVIITSRGDSLEGVEHTDTVLSSLEPVLEGSGLEADPVKQDELENAEENGTGFSTVFFVFAQFSIAAGILLIFLIFVMLAAERKRELGIARAVGTQRGQVIRLFTFEGAVYTLIAAAMGSLLGVVVGLGMVRIMGVAFADQDFSMVFDFQWRSVVIAYTLGMVLTFAVVLVSSWRVSRLNIARAVRDIPEPRITGKSLRGLIMAILTPIAGVLLAILGYNEAQLFPFMLGTSLVIIGVPLLARRLGLPDRAAYTAAGLGLVVWWLLPFDTLEAILPDMAQDISMFFLSGIMLVIGAVWTVIYNADLLLNVTVRLLGRIGSPAPVLKIAVTYPMQNRLRTGMTLAMFSLVVFTLTVMGFIISGTAAVFENPDRISGGYQVRAFANPANPISDIQVALSEADGVSLDDFQAIASFTGAQVQMKQEGTDKEPVEQWFIRGLDAGYTDSVTHPFALMAEGYSSPRQVWQALQEEPGTAVVRHWMVPTRNDFDVGESGPDFQLEGFFLEDETLPEVYILAEDRRTGNEERLRVIGVMRDGTGYAAGVNTSQDTLNSLLGQIVPPNSYMFRLNPGVDAEATAKALEASFLGNGMQAKSIAKEIREEGSIQQLINMLLEGFMGLGLVVGIAALGVIAARSVVERRQQIGVLRALGFQKGMVQLSFLLESSFIALLGIAIGLALGVGLSYNLIAEVAKDVEGLEYRVPWLNIAVVVIIAYSASLLTTYLPARQAAKVYPAEALRYE